MGKIVRKKLADGTIKTYEYPNEKFRKPALKRILASREGLVYFVQAQSGPVKIGFTLDFPRRLHNLQQGNHEKLTVLAIFAADARLERRLLSMFRPDRIHGEWFRHSERLVREIRRLAEDFKAPKSLTKEVLEHRLETSFHFGLETNQITA